MTVNYFMIATDTTRDLVDQDAPFTASSGSPRVTTVDSGKVTGVPSDLSGSWGLYKPSGAPYDDVMPWNQSQGRRVGQMVWPSGFHKSVFRAVRDPGIFTDDSGNSLAVQVYTHGWLLAERLAWYLQDIHEYDLTWQMAQDEITVVPITGTSVVNDGRGFHGFQTVT